MYHLQVLAVHDLARKAVGPCPVGHVLNSHLLDLGHRDGIAIVLAGENHRQLVDTGKVERLVKVAFARRPLPKGHQRHRVLALQHAGQGHASGVGELRGDRA